MTAPSGDAAPSKLGALPKFVGLSALDFAQGVPLGIAADYLPVALREAHASYTLLAAIAWLQLPWMLKVLWAPYADAPRWRRMAPRVVVMLQLAMASSLALYTYSPVSRAPAFWFFITALTALLSSSQDVFVDGLAVRSLTKTERGLGNTAQVGAYRLGMVAGGAGLLSGARLFGSERNVLLALAALTAVLASGVAWIVPDDGVAAAEREGPCATTENATLAETRRSSFRLAIDLLGPSTRNVLLIAFVFKLGLHMASGLLKPVLVDVGWKRAEIGSLVVFVGTIAGVVGSLVGGVLHRRLGDRAALATAALAQAAGCFPLFFLATHGTERAWVTFVLAAEHAASGIATTVLFAALMGATNPKRASFEFTLLSTANALSLGLAGFVGALLADKVGPRFVFLLGALLSLAALALVPGFSHASQAMRARDA